MQRPALRSAGRRRGSHTAQGNGDRAFWANVAGLDDAAVMTSAWGNNLVFIKALRWLAWLRPLAGSVTFMTVSY